MTYEIQDSINILHESSDKVEIDKIWDCMTLITEELAKERNISYEDAAKLRNQYDCPYQPPLKLVQVHRIHK